MKSTFTKVASAGVMVAALFAANSAHAICANFTRAQLQNAINTAVGDEISGFNLPMWMTFVDESGTVCEVVTSGVDGSAVTSVGNAGVLVSRDKWLGSRVISAQKANTANAFSLNGVSISSGALFAAVQPGASLFGLQESNPVDAAAAYGSGSSASSFGTSTDPMKGKRIGGVNVFGGGLAVYIDGRKVGAIGVSGDTSCTDHATAWRARAALNGDPGLANFPDAGGFERLTLTDVYANLGDHPDCALSDGLAGNADAGYN